MAQVDLEDDWSPLDDLVALHTADDAGELRRLLLCIADGTGSKADAFEPWCLFHKVHADEPEDAVITALLLPIDRRWSSQQSRQASAYRPGSSSRARSSCGPSQATGSSVTRGSSPSGPTGEPPDRDWLPARGAYAAGLAASQRTALAHNRG